MTDDTAGVETSSLPGLQGSDMLRMLVENVRDYAMFILDPTGIVATWNVGAQRIKGYDASEIIGRHFSIFYPQDAILKGWPDEELRRASQLGRFEDEGWRMRRDGTRFWANVIITALRAPQGELLGFAKVTRDLTERREHEERLRHSEENLRLLVEGVKDHAIFLVDGDGAVRSWNAGAENLLGYTEAEILGRDCAIFYSAEDVADGKPQAELAAARQAGYSEDIGWRIRANGTRLWADVTMTALRDSDGDGDGDGSSRGFVQIVRDLSERRRVQQLEVEGRRINEFIAMLAHELRNPMAPIANAVGILEKVGTQKEVIWCTELIGRQVSHLSRLVDDLLDVSRITSGKIRLRKERLDLNEQVRAAVESVRSFVESFGHVLVVVGARSPVLVDADAKLITMIFVNLATNAAKYTPNGGRVTVKVVPGGSTADIVVADNGIGMSKALIETAFDLFVQGERALDRAGGGLGIGLTLVKRIAALHGATVGIYSEGVGRGSTFTVTLPLAD